MSSGVLQRIDRRGFLAAAAAVLALDHGKVFGQTQIQDTPVAGGFGFNRESNQPDPYAPEESAVRVHQPSVTSGASVSGPHVDWRRSLLIGDRSITMRRDDGRMQRVRYCMADGFIDRDGYGKACMMLRDVKAGKLYPIDPRLLDILCGLQRWAEYNGRSANIQLLSGFRTLSTNSALEGSAQNSMHLYGRAADIHFEGMSSALLGAMVKAFNDQGGTGIYLNRGFVHVDTGAARSWISRAPSKHRA